MNKNDFYLRKAKQFIVELNEIDIDQLDLDRRRSMAVALGSNSTEEDFIKTENLGILEDIKFQVKLLFSSHSKSQLFLDRLNTIQDHTLKTSENQKVKNTILKVLHEFINYLEQYEKE